MKIKKNDDKSSLILQLYYKQDNTILKNLLRDNNNLHNQANIFNLSLLTPNHAFFINKGTVFAKK